MARPTAFDRGSGVHRTGNHTCPDAGSLTRRRYRNSCLARGGVNNRFSYELLERSPRLGFFPAQTWLHDSRNSGFTCVLASSLLVNRNFELSHSSLPSTRMAIVASRIHSVNGPATLKSEQDRSPPLQARSQSR